MSLVVALYAIKVRCPICYDIRRSLMFLVDSYLMRLPIRDIRTGGIAQKFSQR